MRLRPSSCALAFLCAPAFAANAFAQGSLTPPGGPSPTMKTLDQIEARTPISTLPFAIASAGSYYLTGNLTATGSGAGITVSADNVTLDLNGFTLTGGGGGAVAGIVVPAAQKNLCLRNGTVSGWASGGVRAGNVTGALFERLRIVGNGGGASALFAGVGSTLKDCVVTGNASYGINVSNACTLVSCSAVANGAAGIITSDNCTLVHCTADQNFSGIDAGNGCTLTDCTAGGNAANGISAYGGCTVRNCTVRGNARSGISVLGTAYVVGNTCDFNNTSNAIGFAGILVQNSGNRIEANNITANNYAGLLVQSPGNLIIRNSFSGAEYIVVNGNTLGPLIDMASGGTISSTNPWANFHY